mgnify:CR=1 FL=1
MDTPVDGILLDKEAAADDTGGLASDLERFAAGFLFFGGMVRPEGEQTATKNNQ